MPTATYLQLEAAKRERVLSAAIAEFAAHAFADARLDRIAAEASVSKGSLFQYFEDKHEFYVHAVGEALERAWTFHSDFVDAAGATDCFDLVRHTLLGMAALRRRQPELATLFLRVVYGNDSYARDELYERFVARNEEFYGRLIPWGIETGHIDATLPERVVRFHVHAVGSHFTYLVLSGDDPRWLPRSAKALRTFVDETVAALARALAPPAAGPPPRRSRS